MLGGIEEQINPTSSCSVFGINNKPASASPHPVKPFLVNSLLEYWKRQLILPILGAVGPTSFSFSTTTSSSLSYPSNTSHQHTPTLVPLLLLSSRLLHLLLPPLLGTLQQSALEMSIIYKRPPSDKAANYIAPMPKRGPTKRFALQTSR